MTDSDVLKHVEEKLPGFAPARAPEKLTGGLLNHVWRIHGRSGSYILKWAPPHVASAPEVPLSPERCAFEAAALTELAPGGSLAHVAEPGARPPRILDFDAEKAILLMEDLGDLPHLGTVLTTEAGVAATRRLAQFVARLHRHSAGQKSLARRFHNRGVQSTRLEIQYRAVGPLLRAAGLLDSDALGERAVALGQRLLEPGHCLIMGDLWPASVLVNGSELRIIDWEFCHYGNPAQDVGHIAAHIWMYGHRAPTPAERAAASQALTTFITTYRFTLGGDGDAVFPSSVSRDTAIHFGCEVAARVSGPFQIPHLYGGLAPNGPECTYALGRAADAIRAPERDLATIWALG